MKEPPLKILIIDDDPVDREIFKQYLEASKPGGFSFAEEPTGKNGLALLESLEPDCVLLDFNLPDLDGLTIVRRLGEGREFLPCPIVMLTAIGSERVAVEAMKLGLMDYVVKGPATSEALPRTVASAIQRFQLQQQVLGQRAALERRNAELEETRAALFEEKERYRTLTEAIPQLVWTADSERYILFCNKRLQEFSGKPAGEVWPLENLVHRGDRAAFMQKWQEAVESRCAFESELRLIRARDGAVRFHLMRATPIQADGILEWFGTFTDVEDQRRSEEALRQRQKLDSIGLLAGGIAHDFNNLLVGIMGGASFVLDMLEPDHAARPMLEVVVRSSERAAHLTRQLLAYAGKDKNFAEPVNVPRVIRDTCELVRVSVPKTITIVNTSDSHIPVIETNTAQIQQLIMNLLINATEAIGEKNGLVSVRTTMEQLTPESRVLNVLGQPLMPGEYVSIEISDSGVGMDEAMLARIFDPFFTTKFTGRGLGLAAVQGIVRSLGGAIEVQSAPGEGSTFTVLLPAVKPRGEWMSRPEPGTGTLRTVILVIDDEEVVRVTAANALNHAGHEVISAAGGSEGLRAFRENSDRIGLVLLDLSMPGMSGIETLERLRKISDEVPVVIMSGYSEQDVSARLSGRSVCGLIHKPFTITTLLSEIDAFLSSAEAEEISAPAAANPVPEKVRYGADA